MHEIEFWEMIPGILCNDIIRDSELPSIILVSHHFGEIFLQPPSAAIHHFDESSLPSEYSTFDPVSPELEAFAEVCFALL